VPGCVSGVEDSAARMPPLAMQVVAADLIAIKVRPERDELVHPLWPLAHDEVDDLLVAEAGAAGERVLNVKLKGVVGLVDRRDAALRPQGGGGAVIFLEEDSDAAVLSRLEGEGSRFQILPAAVRIVPHLAAGVFRGWNRAIVGYHPR